jgi:hypothetical protein
MFRFHGIGCSTARVALLAALPAAASLVWSAPAVAASACLKGDALNKLCVTVESMPETEVQPSGLAGTKTYVKYDVGIRNLVAATSRNVLTTLTIDPAPASPLTFTADAGLECSVSGATVSCLADKLGGIDPLDFTVTAEAPQYPATVAQMLATATIGWNGNTAQTTHALAVSNTAGDSYVPANQQVTLATDDSDDVTAEKPRYGRITLPPQPYDYVASIEVVGDAPANANCVNGIYLSASYGGPYVCRDTATPQRAIRIDLGDAEFTADNPVVYVEKWDTTIVPATQLPPSPAAPTGLPPFAQFTAPLSTAGSPSAPYSAWIVTCGVDATGALVEPPCMTSVQQLPNGDWQVDSLRISHESALLVRSPVLAPLYAVLDFLVKPAHAQIQLPTKPGTGFMQ